MNLNLNSWRSANFFKIDSHENFSNGFEVPPFLRCYRIKSAFCPKDKGIEMKKKGRGEEAQDYVQRVMPFGFGLLLILV